MSIVISNAFKVIEGRPVTSSRIVAEYFGKQHHHVVRDIRSLIEQKPSLEASANFGEWSEEVEIGSGAKRTVTGYWMDQKGFCILAMGFTGAKALEFKCAFYDEFERMKNELEGRRIEPATLTPAEQRAIQVAVAGRAKKLAASYQAIYRAIKARYQIAKYDQLPRTLLKDCLKFIESVELNVPELTETKHSNCGCPQCGLVPLPKGYVVLNPNEVGSLLGLVYEINYRHKETFEHIQAMLDAVNSPLTGLFYDFVNDSPLFTVERTLRKHGACVENLMCYKHFVKKLNA